MRKPCLHRGCAAIVERGSYCRAHDPKLTKTPTPGRRGQGTFRRAVLARAGGRCEQCGGTRNVQAHHLLPLREGGTHDPSNGVLLCGPCHGRAEAARRR